MSIEGYFDGILETWFKYPEHTECMLEEMKTVIRQFDESKTYGDISGDRIDDLTEKFNKVRQEVYK